LKIPEGDKLVTPISRLKEFDRYGYEVSSKFFKSLVN
jgi:hypothetical protein